ncbi:hypothetical protein CYMTET_41642 [Cymbomonas tetramitiformis]|uniref:Probable pectate lyase C n=1 Tax=Cymbomonas tetramitiformis TaxID=36881 RepID=A0AAE0C5S5_9CHLO|nr:hypothetical protein CYMTET_41642 [Cymbomonas tetramitiformis]
MNKFELPLLTTPRVRFSAASQDTRYWYWALLLLTFAHLVEAQPLQFPSFEQLDFDGDGVVTNLEYKLAINRAQAARDTSAAPPHVLPQLDRRGLQQLPAFWPPMSQPPLNTNPEFEIPEGADELTAFMQDINVNEVTLTKDMALDSALPVLTTPFTIQGVCHLDSNRGYCLIDARRRFRVLQVARSGALTLRAVHLTNGFLHKNVTAPRFGAGLLVTDGAQAIVEDCVISNCLLEGAVGGTGVAVGYGGSLYMIRTTVRDNTLISSMGGAGICILDSYAVILNSSMVGNRILDAVGGSGLVVAGNGVEQNQTFAGGSSVTVSGCLISENLSEDTLGGGGVGIVPFMSNSSMQVSFLDTAIHNNVLNYSTNTLENSMYGAGLFAMGSDTGKTSVLMNNCSVRDHYCSFGCEGAGIMLWVNAEVVVQHSVLTNK